jgi:monovalent cation/hydrogen antiporter
VILVTLVGQGLMLPLVMRWLGLAHAGQREHRTEAVEEAHAWRLALEAALARLEELASERSVPDEVVHPLRFYYRDRLRQLEHGHDGDEHHRKLVALSEDIGLEVIKAERDLINDLYRDGKLKDEARRRIERALDLRESDLINQRAED